MSFEKALRAGTTHRHDYLHAYMADLASVIDMDTIRGANITMGVDPLGGAGVHYWEPIAERYGLKLTVVNVAVDPTFQFMTMDWDGQIRMDPFSPYAMQRLIGMKDRFDLSFACDTDHDRHGIVARSAGLLPPNHYLSVAILYIFQRRLQVVRGGSARRLAGLCRGRERGCVVRSSGWHRVDDGQRWHRSGVALGGDDRAHGPRSR